MIILKLLNNGRYAIIETEQTDELNSRPYPVRKVVEVRKEPIVTLDGKVLDYGLESSPRSLKTGPRKA